MPLSSHHPSPCPSLHLLMLLMPPRCTCSKLEQTKRTGGGLTGAGVVEKLGIFDPRLPRIQAPVTQATAPVSRHATLWTKIESEPEPEDAAEKIFNGKNTRRLRRGQQAAPTAYHWVNCPFPGFPPWLHSKSAHTWQNVWKTHSLAVSIQLLRKNHRS